MEKEIQHIIQTLGLQPHPEGGFYGETYRSEMTLDGLERNLLTSIYFLITAGNVSRFHRIKSDELWYFHTGNAVVVHTLDENGHRELLLGNELDKGERPYLLVPSGKLFGSTLRSQEGYALVSCAVAPGFDFKDFELPSRGDLLHQYPDHSVIIEKLTYPDPIR
ncbi:MAG: cupin domain-containing protein [Bacteroidota bacterium]|jgi:predicted cupin superfamily sugar epimerase